MKDVFAVQDEITRAIVNALQIRLADAGGRALPAAHRENLDAWNLSLRGLYYLDKWTPDGARKGIEYFEQAIARQANYAPAWAGMADCYTWLAVYNVLPRAEAMPKRERPPPGRSKSTRRWLTRTCRSAM